MRAALTRSAVRQILRGEPLVFQGCLRRPTRPEPRHRQSLQPRSQRRTLFGFSILRPAPPQNEHNPGLEVMQEALKRQELRARMPETKDLVTAWNNFFGAKIRSGERILDTHSKYALVVLRHLKQQEDAENEPKLDADAFRTALRALAQDEEPRLGVVDKSYNQLARELYAALEIGDPSSQDCGPSINLAEKDLQATRDLVTVLALTGESTDACNIVLQRSEQKSFVQQWRTIFKAMAAGGGSTSLKENARRLQERNEETWSACRDVLINSYCQLGAIDEAKVIFDTFSQDGWRMDFEKPPQVLQVLEPMLHACVEQKDWQYGQAIIQNIVERNLATHHSNELTHLTAWRLIFYWAAATGKSVEEIDRMMKVSTKSGTKVPAVAILGELLDFAKFKNDAYLGERYFALASSWDIRNPGLHAYLRLMELRLQSGDFDGARTVWSNILETPIRSTTRPEVRDLARQVMNRLIVAMCAKGPKAEADGIMPVVDYLIKHFGTFDTETICALAVFHLSREEYHEVVDLLKTHVPNLASQERLKVCNALLAFCLDRVNPITRVWDAYMIFHQIFEAEMDRVILTKLMKEFYTRQQGKMALHAFDLMRDHTREDTVATEETYVDALVAISNIQDGHGLENVHNQLKLDMNVEPTTKILNALMLAYAMCGHHYTAWSFWRRITNSIEGPSFESILIVLRCCEFIPFGEQRATAIWEQFQRLDIEVTPELFAGYIGALAANDCIKEAIALLEIAKPKYRVDVDEYIIGTLLSTIPSPFTQEEVEGTIRDIYPDVWRGLEKIGHKARLNGAKAWKIDRSLRP